MIPIFEQGDGRGVGHSLDTFEERFEHICKEHLKDGRAKSFAFIFYDFTDDALRKILKDDGVFAQMDRLSGKNLSIFYLHAVSRRAVDGFNETFLGTLGVADIASLPCVVFFRILGNQVSDIRVAILNSPNEIHGFHELHSIVEEYLREPNRRNAYKLFKWMRPSIKEIGVGLFTDALFKFLERIL